MSAVEPRFAQLVERFFLEWLPTARRASPHTVSSYRDTFRLLLAWSSDALGTGPCRFSLGDLTRANVLAFCRWLEDGRGCGAKTVNCRLAALKSFCSFASYEVPQRLAQLKAVRDLPQRRERRPEVTYLTPEEVGWVVDACKGRPEDGLLIALLYNTGCRVSEIVGLRVRDISCGEGGRMRIRVLGKGRKERTLPLWKDTSEALSAHVEACSLGPDDHVFPGRNVPHVTRSGVRHRIDAALGRAAINHPELVGRRVGPHTFRHSCAMAMLAAGVDIACVAIWLGHESIDTTHKYVIADMRAKERALSKVRRGWEVEGRDHTRYSASSDIMAFLAQL
ncbi:tyrosine-type recombinase/integrase [Olsenella uli]|jgi:integrase family protein|uniref:tyrosine-type recombinase/integrase n=1 Tax=Olsenella uli TaxID=133926 RepID=UPI0028EC60D1|nr:tyrosine-type recombinase/integrase [Olsenella uli]